MLKKNPEITSKHIQHHLISIHEIALLTNELSDMRVKYLILKGAPLNQLLYANQLTRISRDIDILIQPQDIWSVHQFLLSKGYQLQIKKYALYSMHKEKKIMKYFEEIPYWHPHKNIFIDLKWHIFTMNYLDMSWCNLNNYNLITIRHHKVKILKPEQNFYYLCIHAAKHQWECLQWLQDIATFSKTISFCWDDVILLAQQTKSNRVLLETSYLLRQYFQIKLEKIPHNFLDKILVLIRLSCFQCKWLNNLKKDKRLKICISAILNLLLYPTLPQKCHYITRCLIQRRASIKQIWRLKKPTRCKIILYSLWSICVK